LRRFGLSLQGKQLFLFDLLTRDDEGTAILGNVQHHSFNDRSSPVLKHRWQPQIWRINKVIFKLVFVSSRRLVAVVLRT